MPTILVEGGFRLFFYADEGTEPLHVHVQYQGAVAKFWVKPVSLASNMGMKASDLSKAALLVRKHEELIVERWHEFFSK